MRKFALFFAVAMFASAPLIVTTPSATYAAAKKKAPAKAQKGAKSGGGDDAGGAAGGADLDEVNSRFWRALNDLAISLGKPWPPAGGEGAAPTGDAPKAGKGGKKARS